MKIYTQFILALFCAASLAGCGGGSSAASASASASPSATTVPAPTLTPAPSSKQMLGYFTGNSASLTSATSATTPITAVSMDQVLAMADGSLQGAPLASLVASERSAGKDSYACISNFGAQDFDPNIAHAAMVTSRAVFIQNIVALAKSSNVTGINIDFEGIYPADRDAYTSFVAALATQLHANGQRLMLSVPAKTADDPNATWSWPYDYSALSQSADLLQVMTYDNNVPDFAPGPVAGSDWMQASLTYATSQVAPSKILLGLPAYGYDWNTTTNAGVQVSWRDIPALLATTGATQQWDAATNSAYVNYTASDGSPHKVWYETPQGITLKAHFAVTMHLAGVSMWALGYEDATFWNAVTTGLSM